MTAQTMQVLKSLPQSLYGWDACGEAMVGTSRGGWRGEGLTIRLNSEVDLTLGRMRDAVATECDIRTVRVEGKQSRDQACDNNVSRYPRTFS